MWGIIFYPFWHEKAIKTPNISLKSCQTRFWPFVAHAVQRKLFIFCFGAIQLCRVSFSMFFGTRNRLKPVT